jgi:hypothetical protein
MSEREMTKKILTIAAVALVATIHCTAQSSATVEITNPLSISRPDELVTLPRATITRQVGSAGFITVLQAGKRVDLQYVDENRDGKWDEVVLLYSFKPKEKATFKLSSASSGTSSGTSQRAHVRMRKKNADNIFGPNMTSETMPVRNPATDFSKQPLPMYLTEGPAWENDKVAFRLYFDVRNNKDIYAKTTEKMMMDTVGANTKESYHKLSGWGMDVLHVVKSLGAGALALSVPQAGTTQDTLIRLGGQHITKTVFQQLADGPLLGRFTVTYDWQVNNKPLQVTEDIRIWGGQYFYESKVTVTGAPAGSKLVTGIADFYENSFETLKEGKAVIGFSYGEQSENKDNLGLGVLVPGQHFVKADSINRKNTDVNETYTISQNITGQQPLYYRFYSGWERSDKRFTSFQGFKDYLKQEGLKYSQPIQISWKKG